MYDRKSNWLFFVEDDDQAYNSSPTTTWYLTVVAEKNADWDGQ